MHDIERPNLSHLPAAVVAYIEALEQELLALQARTLPVAQPPQPRRAEAAEEGDEPAEPPTTLNVITLSAAGTGKRTPRHLYRRQRRGGMGIFDLQASEDDPPAILAVADEADTLLLFTNQGRVFRVAVAGIPLTEVRARGQSIVKTLGLRAGETLVAALPEAGDGYYCLASERGWVRRIHYHYLGRTLIPGTTFHNIKEGGYLTHACWTPGGGEVLIATRQGLGIRFNEQQIPARGCLGMRIAPDDRVIGMVATTEDDGVFLLSADGKGTIRLMAGFRAHKAPGAAGKVLIKTDDLRGICAAGVAARGESADVFVISRLGKMVRFDGGEVPAKTGVVQGVNCLALRGDEAVAVVPANH